MCIRRRVNGERENGREGDATGATKKKPSMDTVLNP